MDNGSRTITNLPLIPVVDPVQVEEIVGLGASNHIPVYNSSIPPVFEDSGAAINSGVLTGIYEISTDYLTLNIYSSTGTSDQVLTASGDGTCSWQDPQPGIGNLGSMQGYIQNVEQSGVTGAFGITWDTLAYNVNTVGLTPDVTNTYFTNNTEVAAVFQVSYSCSFQDAGEAAGTYFINGWVQINSAPSVQWGQNTNNNVITGFSTNVGCSVTIFLVSGDNFSIQCYTPYDALYTSPGLSNLTILRLTP